MTIPNVLYSVPYEAETIRKLLAFFFDHERNQTTNKAVTSPLNLVALNLIPRIHPTA